MSNLKRPARFVRRRWMLTRGAILATTLVALTSRGAGAWQEAAVSYHRQVKPIFQVHCWSCHQPAVEEGDYVMTEFADLLAAGASDEPAIVPGDPDASYLIELISPHGDEPPEMPEDRPPLSAEDVNLIRRWVAEGALDDSPPRGAAWTAEHPPEYRRAPVLTALDVSGDGRWLAVNGDHEVLLLSAEDGSIQRRLVGLSQRLESVEFSPDGSRLLVAGGIPGQFGEIQVWNVADGSLALSVGLTRDTLFGATWSPDGQSIAVGCADNTVRVLDATEGRELLYQGAHDDWVLDVSFSRDGSHLVTVGRDMSCKLTEVATNRFVDNVTSITPGGLRGGLASVARHPERDEILVGGADGVPRVYRAFRLTKRVIGDDANLIRHFPALAGRIHAVDISADGRRILAASSLDRSGELAVFGYEFDTSLSDRLKAILEKVVTDRGPEESAELDRYHVEGVTAISRATSADGGFYAACFHPDGRTIYAAGDAGQIFVYDADSGQLERRLTPAVWSDPASEIAAADSPAATSAVPRGIEGRPRPAVGESEGGSGGIALAETAEWSIEPAAIELDGPQAQSQLVLTVRDAEGREFDLTRAASVNAEQGRVRVDGWGRVTPLSDGSDRLIVALAGRQVEVPVEVRRAQTLDAPRFITDVNPVLTKLGCNAGTCHGAAQGKRGFKLSLRGYDATSDVRAFSDDLRCRRVNFATPGESLMVTKPTGQVAHGGGALFEADSLAARLLKEWIADGARLDREAPRVERIEVFPSRRTIPEIGGRQQLRVVAQLTDGSRRDVTDLAFFASGNTEVLEVDRNGLATGRRRGDAAIVVRFEGQYAAAELAVMGPRPGFVWNDPPGFNPIDEWAAAKWREMKILPAPLCSDVEFIRRASLDLTGLPPAADAVRQFADDPRPTQEKRAALVDRLLESPEFVEFWTNKWADLLMVNGKYLGPENAAAFRQWIRGHVESRTPYDEFVRRLITASGSNNDNPAASFAKIHRTPQALTESTTQLFLGIRFNCNKCHDHPFERWTQDQYYETAAFFAQVAFEDDPASQGAVVGGSSVEPARARFEFIRDRTEGEIRHDRTGAIAAPRFPYDVRFAGGEAPSRRTQLAAWLTSPHNPYFARSYANRLWSYMMGVGLIEPVDDLRAGNPPSNPQLLEYLTNEFVSSGFEMRHVLRLIAQSRVYQLSVETQPLNADDLRHYSHALARRLPAEVVFDAIHAVLGVSPSFPGLPPGTRAVQLPDAGTNLPGGFLAAFGRPPRESVCECERRSDLPLGPVMALATGPLLSGVLQDPANRLRQLVAEVPEDAELARQLYWWILNRPPEEREVQSVLEVWRSLEEDHQRLLQLLARADAEFAAAKPQLEADRTRRVASLEGALLQAQEAGAAELQRREADRVVRVADLKRQSGEAEASLASRMAEWERSPPGSSTPWSTLEPHQLGSNAQADFLVGADRRVLVTRSAGPDTYEIVFRSALRRITAIRFEALTDPSLPGGGPGFPSNGNFVVNELKLEVVPAEGGPATEVRWGDVLADFSQDGFPASRLVDGSVEPGNGWAVSPRGFATHWVVLPCAEPLELPPGGTLKLTLVARYGDQHQLGCFRLSATADEGEIGVGLSEELTALVRTPLAARNDAVRQPLRAYLAAEEGALAALARQLAEAEKPLPRPAEIVRLEAELEQARRPLDEPAELRRLRRDVEQSAQQMERRRVTCAEDLAWALINSPAFLFNH